MTLGVAALVFGAIPFTQNKASAQDLAAVRTAQGMAKVQSGRYLSLGSLRNAGYITPSETLAVATDPGGTCFVSVSRSGSGELLIATDESPTPVELAGAPDPGCVSPATVDELAAKAGGPRPAPVMTTVWDTRLDPSCSTITLPLTGTINATIDWGDGTPVQTVTAELPSHTYATAGITTIHIGGTFTGWVGSDWPSWSTACITEVTEWGETGTTDVEAGFYDTAHLTDVARIPWTATNWSYLFMYTGALGGIGDLDTSRVTSMSGMFGDSAFNGDISAWDTSRVTDMSYMFSASSFNQPIGQWDTSQVTTIASMFISSTSFNQPLTGWDTSSVTTMDYAFANTAAFNGNISGWDTSSVTSMQSLFYLSAFNSDIGSWDTSSVTTMNNMFNGSRFNRPIGGWDTSNVSDMIGMFSRATSFNQNINSWDVTGITSAYWGFFFMFEGATSYNQPMNNWDVSGANLFNGMFKGASSFNQDLSGWDTDDTDNAAEFGLGSALTPAHLPPGVHFR